MPAKSKQRGAIQTQYVVRCGAACCTALRNKTAASLEAAQVAFKGEGWAHVEPFGWLCPDHAQEHGVKPLAVIPNIEQLNRWQLSQMRKDTGNDIAAARLNDDGERVAALRLKLKTIDGELLKRQHGDF